MDDERRSVYVREPLYREDTIEQPGKPPNTLTSWWALWRHPPRHLVTWRRLIGVFLLANAAVLPMMEVIDEDDFGALIVFACMGIIPVQAAALSIWLAWGPRPFWKRLALHWWLAAAGILTWLVGLFLAEGPRDFEEALEVILPTILLFGLALQLPLWIVRSIWGWRLVREPSNDPISEDKLSIRDLMVGTVIVAVSMAAVRLSPESDDSDYWPAIGIMVLVPAGAGTFVLLPASRWLLAGRNPHRGALWTLLYALLGVVVMVVLFVAMGHGRLSGAGLWHSHCDNFAAAIP